MDRDEVLKALEASRWKLEEAGDLIAGVIEELKWIYDHIEAPERG